MLYSRAGDYPPGQAILYAESFSPNTPEGACPACHGLGRVYDATEASMVPDDSLTIRERAIAAWPPAWQGQNLRDIVTTLGIDIDVPWRDLPKKDRDWILFTDEQPQVPVYPRYTPEEVRRALKKKEEPHDYLGTFTSARRYVLETFAKTESALMKRRVPQFLVSTDCPACRGKRLRPEALSVTFAGLDITEHVAPAAEAAGRRSSGRTPTDAARRSASGRTTRRRPRSPARIAEDLEARLDRPARPRARLPDAGTEHADPVAGRTAAAAAGDAGAVEPVRRGVRARRAVRRAAPGRHRSAAARPRPAEGRGQLAVRRRARTGRDPPRRLDRGRRPGGRRARRPRSSTAARPTGSNESTESRDPPLPVRRTTRPPTATRGRRRGWLRLAGVTRNNLQRPRRRVPARRAHGRDRRVRVRQVEPGQPGAGGAGRRHLGHESPLAEDEAAELDAAAGRRRSAAGSSAGMEGVKRLVVVDQKPIGRTPRSNLATYTGLFDHVRKLFAATKAAKARRYGAGRFSFNVAERPVRDVRRRGVRDGRAPVPAERLLAVPDLPRLAVQRQDAGGRVPRQEHRRRARDDGGRGLGVPGRRAARPPVARRAAGRRARLPAARPAGDRTVRRRGPADQAGDRAAAGPARRRASTCWTSRRPDCTRRTSRG